ncbi:major facilitator superfamily domain-containing protein [Limtongia smithiae]|uniref:major facilitator superfamily domain-containing protein n=1 Tax=Limtongia smithiae TaxID=1125753 RepID=UPI0034CF01F0
MSDKDTEGRLPLLSSDGAATPEVGSSASTSADSTPHSSQTHISLSTDAIDDLILRTHVEEEAHFEDDFGNPTRSLKYVSLLALPIGGLQLSWSTEFSNGTPFLLSLGMSKTLMSLVWIAGPLSGVLVQPVIGLLSDSSTSPYGRRRPFMIIGTIFTTISLFMLSWSKDIVAVLFGWLQNPAVGITQILAVLMVYLLDFSVGTVQASSRAFIVDNVPIHQQQTANAWAAILTGVGNIIGFIFGTMDLPDLFPFLGNTQFKVLCVFASLALILSVGFASKTIHERNPRMDVYLRDRATGRLSVREYFKETLKGISRLSPQVRLICDIEFFAWIGYFPMLFYTTTYVGEIYYREVLESRREQMLPPLTDEEYDLLWEAATRYASRALLLYSLMSFVANLILPIIITPTYLHPELQQEQAQAAAQKWQIKWLTLPRSWMASHVLFVAAMISTFFIRTGAQASVMIMILGIPWAHALWAPFALIAEDIARVKLLLPQSSLSPLATARKAVKYEHEAGIIMGVHNVFVSLPQVLSSLASSVLFKFLSKPGRGEENDNSIVWIFRLSGLGALVAAYLSTKIKNPDELRVEDVFADSDDGAEDDSADGAPAETLVE